MTGTGDVPGSVPVSTPHVLAREPGRDVEGGAMAVPSRQGHVVSLPGWLPGSRTALHFVSVLGPESMFSKITGYGKGSFRNQAVIPGGELFYR